MQTKSFQCAGVLVHVNRLRKYIKTSTFLFHVNFYVISPSSHIKSLCVILDNSLSFETHVNNVTQSKYFYLWNISCLHPFLTLNTTAILVHALVTSHVGYCNSLLFGLPLKLHKFQLVQDSAHIIAITSFTEFISPVLYQLHWLPVKWLVHPKMKISPYFTHPQDILGVYDFLLSDESNRSYIKNGPGSFKLYDGMGGCF